MSKTIFIIGVSRGLGKFEAQATIRAITKIVVAENTPLRMLPGKKAYSLLQQFAIHASLIGMQAKRLLWKHMVTKPKKIIT